MLGRSIIITLNHKANALKVKHQKIIEAEKHMKFGRIKQVGGINCSVTKYLYSAQRLFSHNAFNEVFSDLSKQQFIKSVQELKCKNNNQKIKDAAVLVPLCKVDTESSVLLTLRSSKLGRNKGDVSFPGGMRDNSDKSVIDLALRETEEEIGLSVDADQIWTIMPSISRHDMQITPVIAFIGNVDVNDFVVNDDEVENVFSLTLKSLCDPSNQFYTEFKPGYALPVYIVGEHRIWGLTAGILHHLLRILLPNIYINDSPLLYTGIKSRRNKINQI